MPVWHEKTKQLVESGELVLVGITQEQHPDRCALFAQWKEFDFPILWDPFGVTGLSVVPVITAIDEHGVVRLARPDPRKFDEQFVAQFMERTFDAPAGDAEDRPQGFRVSDAALGSSAAKSMARLLHGGAHSPTVDADVAALTEWADEAAEGESEDAAWARFCAGVAQRMRSDGPRARAGDFQAAADAWHTALNIDPNQYIWRRRIQQWGPRLDKPYAFYDWVEGAQSALRERGATPIAIEVPLSGSEVASKSREVPNGKVADERPPASDGVTRDSGELVRAEVTTLLHTGNAGPKPRTPRGASRVHVSLQPRGDDVTWGLDADPPLLWVDLPEGWQLARQLVTFSYPERESSGAGELGDKSPDARAQLRIDFGLSTPPVPLGPPPEDGGPPPAKASLPAFLLYSVCLEDGTCVFRRQDVSIDVDLPAPPARDD